MINIEAGSAQDEKYELRQMDDAHYRLAIHIHALNQTRNEFMPDLVVGDPVWDTLLDLFVSEYLEQSTTIVDLAYRSKISVSVCERSVKYLVDQSAVIENPDRFNKTGLRFLVSEDIKVAICAWLDSCTVSAAQS